MTLICLVVHVHDPSALEAGAENTKASQQSPLYSVNVHLNK